jgi:hypothetical protein
MAPSEDGATQAGGHAAQVDRAPFREQQAHAADPTSGSSNRNTTNHHPGRRSHSYPAALSGTSLAEAVTASPVGVGCTFSTFRASGSSGTFRSMASCLA